MLRTKRQNQSETLSFGKDCSTTTLSIELLNFVQYNMAQKSLL
jgi:hypothetical protein